MNKTYRHLSLLIGTALLAGCGFHLRGSQTSDGTGQQLFVERPGATRVGTRIPEIVRLTGAELSRNMVDAKGVIRILKETDERRTMSLNLGGRGNLFDLYTRVRYEVTTPQGEIIIPPQEVEVKREYFNNQLSPIGQGEEESLLRSEMEREVAETLVRRVLIEMSRNPGGKS
ncbi:MAG: LPS assembly lipoprotein LptE [Pseudomonadota bacterium]